MVGRVRPLPLGHGRRRAVDRHRHARAGRRPPRRPPPPRRGDRPGRGGRRRGADQGVLRPRAGLGAVAPARLRAGPADRRAGGRQPRPAGRRARRPRPDHLGRHLRGVPGHLARRHPPGRAVHRRAGPARPARRRCGRASSRCRPPSAGAWPASWRPTSGACAPPTGGWSGRLDRQRPGARLPGPRGGRRGWRRWARRAPTTSSAPRCARCCSTCRPTAPVDELVARLRELHAAYRDDYAAYYRRHADPRLAAHAGRRPGDRAGPRRRHVQLRRRRPGRPDRRRVLRQRHQRDARRRGAVDLRADRRVREVPHRVLGAGGGQAAPPAPAEAAGRPGGARDRRGVGHRPGHRRPARRPRAPRSCRRPRRRRGRGRGRRRWAARTWRWRSRSTSATRPPWPAAVAEACRHLRRRRPGGEQRRACRSPSRWSRPPPPTGTSSTG